MLPKRPLKILLVEDHPGDVRLTQEALKRCHATCTLDVVSDGIEALSYLRLEGKYKTAQTPDLVLMDLNLPRMDGREAIRAIKADKNISWIPIVVLTTSDSAQDIKTAYGVHANSYVIKPIDLNQFCEVLAGIINYWGSISIPPSPGN